MKKLQKIVALTAAMAMLASPVYSQPYYDNDAYEDGSSASRMSIWIPVGALVVAGIIIATTNRHHHHHSSGSSSSSHAHFGSGSSSSF